MRHRFRTMNALLSILLSLSMCTPMVQAEEDGGVPAEEISETEEVTGFTDEIPGESGEEPDVTDRSEEPGSEEEISEITEEKTEEEITDETEPEITEEVPSETETPEAGEESVNEEEKDAEEEAEDSALFKVPEGFEVSESDRQEKAVLKEQNIPASLEAMTPGVDYIENELILYSEEEAYALAAAEIYHGTLSSWEYGIGVITITDEEITVKDAVLAAIEEENLPLVEPNYLNVIDFSEEARLSAEEGTALPTEKDYSDWVFQTFKNPDPNLKDPSSDKYAWQLDDIGAYAAWNATMGSSSVKVAVIDTTVNGSHEELSGKVTNYSVGKDTFYGESGHGTAMAGVIAATANNGKGGAGIAPNVKILGINIFYYNSKIKSETYNTEDLVRAIGLAVENKAWIINMSLGSAYYSSAEQKAIKDAYNNGVTIVASAGNDGSNILRYPAAYEQVISVGATDRTRTKDFYSNYGPTVTVSAPGSRIYVPVTTNTNVSNNTYNWTSGTSPAAAVVSGALALYMSKNNKIKPAESFALVKNYTEKCSSSGMGSGVINVGKMFNADTEAPSITVYDKKNNPIDKDGLKKPVSEGSYAMIYNANPGNSDTILYTTDGKKPAIKDGEVITGNVYTPGTRISLDQFEKNTTVKLTAVVVNGHSVAGKAATVSVKTPVPAAAAVKIKTLKLDQTKAAIDVSAARGIRGSVILKTSQLINTNNVSVSLSSVKHQWTSSNPAVAKVDSSGKVTAVSAGTAKITLKILDGSNKSASCSITVSQLAESVVINGQNAVVPGGSASYKAVFTPDKTKTKKVDWSLSKAVNGVEIDKNGKVKVAATVAANTSFTIVAKTTDGSNITVQKTVKVAPKATAIAMDTSDARAEKKNNVLQSAYIFAEDLKNTSQVDNVIQLTSKVTGNNIKPLWTSSNPKVATVDQNGKVTAVSAGSTKITVEAADGSKKKATATINVRVPVSSMTFNVGFNEEVGAGKSLDLNKKLAFGSTYGKPTVAKADWAITKVEQGGKNITKAVLSMNLITLKNGKVSVSSSIAKSYPFSNGPIYFEVTAKSTDGSDQKATCRLVTIPAATMVQTFDASGQTSFYVFRNGSYSFLAYSDQPIYLEASSSNPDVAGVIVNNNPVRDYRYLSAKRKYYYGYFYTVSIFTKDKKGSAKITVKALDGSGKSGKMSISVR